MVFGVLLKTLIYLLYWKSTPLYPLDPPSTMSTSCAIDASLPTSDQTASLNGSGTCPEVEGTRLASRLARYSSHHDFLSTCLLHGVTPNGLRVRFPFTGLPDSAPKDRIRAVLSQTEVTIMEICTNFYKEQVTHLKSDYDVFKNSLADSIASEVLDSVDLKATDLKKKLKATKQRKLNDLLKKATTNHLTPNPEKASTNHIPANPSMKTTCPPHPDHHRKMSTVRTRSKKPRNRRFKRRPQISITPEPNQVINLSSIELTNDQVDVLSLGPKFCPAPKSVDELELLTDVQEGNRRLRLKEFFHQDNAPSQLPSKLKFYKKTGWMPPEGRDKALDAYCGTLESMVKSYIPPRFSKKNISKNQQKAISELRQQVKNRTLRISTADKGGAIVVQDFSQYEAEAIRQLNNPIHYQPLTTDPTKDIVRESNELVSELRSQNHIDENTCKWAKLEENSVRTPVFYHLPKIHKCKENPPGRPIVSGVSGPTEKLSKLVDYWIQPLVQATPAFLRDTTHFLQVVEEWKQTYDPLPQEALFVTIDVVGLYSNIPHHEVETSLRAALTQHRDLVPEAPPTDTIMKIVQHVLGNNVLDYDGHIFQQIHGTAMGTPMAPSIANLFMAWLEEDILARSPWKIDSSLWRRFIDDVATLWSYGEDQLQLFLQWLNLQHPTIKFTANYGTTKIPFLDVSVSVNDGQLTTDLHVKDTDAHLYLPFTSCHPRHCTRSIPHSQCLRIRRICSSDTAFLQRCRELKDRMMKRGYPGELLESAIADVAKLPREQTLSYVPGAKQITRTPYVVTHNPHNPPLSKWLKQCMPVLHTSYRMLKAVPEPPIVGERNCTNLRKLLMPSAPPPAQLPSAEPPGCYRCNGNRCVICKYHLNDTATFRSVVTGESFSIRDPLSCCSRGLVYLVDCSRCEKVQYVGETGQTLKQRFYGHRTDIKNLNQKPSLVARHFNEAHHSKEDLRVTAIELIRGRDPDGTIRKARERFWRHKLHTNFPSGLNVFD